jgi:ANTAR domain-containing protein
VIPGPRPSKGHDRPSVGRDRGADDAGRALPALRPEVVDVASDSADSHPPVVSLTRTSRGWSVTSPAGAEEVVDLVEGLSLADLVAEELGVLMEPDRSARRSARGHSGETAEVADPVDARIAALERTVAQLEHALAARVSTERAIGVLAERHGISARSAFESLRGDARSQGRPVAQLAREVLDGLGAGTSAEVDASSCQNGGSAGRRSVPGPPQRRGIDAAVPAVGAPDGRS